MPVEEQLYRGYAVERLAVLTGRWSVGGTIAAIVFGLAHAPFWGLGPALAANLPFGLLMVAAYAWRRDLVAKRRRPRQVVTDDDGAAVTGRGRRTLPPGV